jgi:hypothetical protein
MPLEVVCGNCKEMVFRWPSRDPHRFRPALTQGYPTECTKCGRHFDLERFSVEVLPFSPLSINVEIVK